jgi:hypothetical protein
MKANYVRQVYVKLVTTVNKIVVSESFMAVTRSLVSKKNAF